MEEISLFESIEKFLKNEMDESERVYFEEMRKNNPELDQQIVEYIYFIKEFEKYSDKKRLLNKLSEANTQLSKNGLVDFGYSNKNSKVVFLWNKYKKTIAVAASIAIIVSIISATIISTLTRGKQSNIRPLVEKLKQQDDKYRKLEKQIGQLNELNKKDEINSQEIDFMRYFINERLNKLKAQNFDPKKCQKH